MNRDTNLYRRQVLSLNLAVLTLGRQPMNALTIPEQLIATQDLVLMVIQSANACMKCCRKLHVSSLASLPFASKSLSAPLIYASTAREESAKNRIETICERCGIPLGRPN